MYAILMVLDELLRYEFANHFDCILISVVCVKTCEFWMYGRADFGVNEIMCVITWYIGRFHPTWALNAFDKISGYFATNNAERIRRERTRRNHRRRIGGLNLL